MAGRSVSGSSVGFGWRRFLSTVALVVVAGSMVVGVVIYPRVAAVAGEAAFFEFPLAALLVSTLLGLAFSLCGYVILRQTANRIGWLLQGTGLLFGFIWVGLSLNALDAAGRDIGVAGRLTATWLGFGWYPALMLMAVLLPLLFPTGRPPSGKWIWVAVVAATALAYGLWAVTVETLAGPLVEVLGPESRSWPVLTGLGVAGVTGAGISVVVRYRRADAVERLQIKWVAATFVLLCLTIALSLTPLVIRIAPQLGAVLGYTVFSLVPVSIVFAITKQRLYDIDRIISRTLSYAVIIGALLAVYTGALAVLTQIVPLQSDLAVAASTLGAAALFNPLRRRIQAWVDRRFNRTRYVAERKLALLMGRLQDITELPAVQTDLFGLVHRTLQPSALTLWIRKPAG
jgi:hypothetical protein